MKKNIRTIIFTIIILICIFAINYAIYWQFFRYRDKIEEEQIISQELSNIENEFNSIFTNSLDYQGTEVDITGITKIDSSKDLIYTWASREKTVNGQYELNLNIPRVNISNTSVEKFNNKVKELYIDKANDIILKANNNINTNNTRTNSTNNSVMTNSLGNVMTNTMTNSITNNITNNINTNTIMNDNTNDRENTTIYTVEYAGYINANILSLIIKSTLKEENNPQRVMIQTFNYNLSTNEEITLNSILEIKGLDKDVANNNIMTKVKQATQRTQDLKNLGFSDIYTRDLTSDIYDISNATNYILGKDGHLYIVYAYGNNNFTDEMDIIVF